MREFFVQTDNKTQLEVNDLANCKANWLTLGMIELDEDEELNDGSIVNFRNPYVSLCDMMFHSMFSTDRLFNGPKKTLGEFKRLYFGDSKERE